LFTPGRRQRNEVDRGDVVEIHVCHGNLIRWLVAAALEAEPALWSGMSSHHTGLTRLRVLVDGEVVVESFDETAHLKPSDRTR
jgi:hypothetical protein